MTQDRLLREERCRAFVHRVTIIDPPVVKPKQVGLERIVIEAV